MAYLWRLRPYQSFDLMNQFAPSKNIKDTRIVVAMSGGVDSSVVATMLHKQGYEVIGVTLQLYDVGIDLEKKGACCAGKDIYDARNVAQSMGFPHYVLNYESIFKQEVMEDFADSYLRGETPIPCIKCNQSVKFRDLFKVAKDLNADALVTGHYVQRKAGEFGVELHKAADDSKDQSYFLFKTTKEQLEYIHFPLGAMNKEQTRQLAEEFGLEVADKPDSQDICFVPNGSYANVIERLRPGALDSGDIFHMDGRKLGGHNGIINYTIGQRRGLGIAWPEPLYVIKLEPSKNLVYVGEEKYLFSHNFTIKDTNWLIAEEQIKQGLNVQVRTRSTHKGVTAYIQNIGNNMARVELKTPERAITPGQACVAYDGTKVIGGGWIV